jgi:hypothetical protein
MFSFITVLLINSGCIVHINLYLRKRYITLSQSYFETVTANMVFQFQLLMETNDMYIVYCIIHICVPSLSFSN